MTLTADDVVTHYVLSSHPRNKAIIDVKNKKTGQLCFIKIRHRLPKFYAVSLVDPVTFQACADTQAASATSRVKPITIHLDNDTDATIDFRETARISFEWSFEWENEKYKWIKESKMKSALECRAIRKAGNICVAQYLPCTLKDEYFGIFTVLSYNMIRCNLNKSHQLELILIMSLLTLLDKSNDGEWKKDNVSQEIAVPLESIKKADEKRIQQKKQKAGQLNDLKLEMMLEKDARRSRKQMQMDEKRLPVSAGNSPLHSPKMSPLPTPTTSLNHVTMLDDFRLQQHPPNLDVYGHPNKMLSSIHYDHGPFRMKPDTTVKPYEFGGYERTSSGFLNMNGQSRKKY